MNDNEDDWTTLLAGSLSQRKDLCLSSRWLRGLFQEGDVQWEWSRIWNSEQLLTGFLHSLRLHRNELNKQQ